MSEGLFPTNKPEKPVKLYGNTREETEAILHLLKGKAKCDLTPEARKTCADRLEKAMNKKWPPAEEPTEESDGEASE